jgi:hypothetical protein
MWDHGVGFGLRACRLHQPVCLIEAERADPGLAGRRRRRRIARRIFGNEFPLSRLLERRVKDRMNKSQRTLFQRPSRVRLARDTSTALAQTRIAGIEMLRSQPRQRNVPEFAHRYGDALFVVHQRCRRMLVAIA